MRTAKKLEDIWKHNKLLVAKKSPHKLHFVCLEGSCGTGKAELLRRLERMGFRTIAHRYYDHVVEMRCTTGHSARSSPATSTQLPPSASHPPPHNIHKPQVPTPLPLLSAHLWASKMIDAFRAHAHAKREGVQYKDNTVFVHRSLLTPVVLLRCLWSLSHC